MLISLILSITIIINSIYILLGIPLKLTYHDINMQKTNSSVNDCIS